MPSRSMLSLAAVFLLAAVPAARAAENLPGIGRLIHISDVPGIKRPNFRYPSTADLGRRRGTVPDQVLPGGVRVMTRCRGSWCVDGLLVGDRVLIPPEPSAADRRWLREGWMERVVRVVFQDDTRVSVYVAEVSYADGAAHANNDLGCRTYDLASGRAVTLADVLPKDEAAGALARARRTLRSSDDFVSFTVWADGFRFRAAKPATAGAPDLLLCLVGPMGDASILEMKVKRSLPPE